MGVRISLGACCAVLLVFSVLSANQQVLGIRESVSAGADKQVLLCYRTIPSFLQAILGCDVTHAVQNVLLLPTRQREHRLKGCT